MSTLSRNLMALALTAAFALPVAVLAAEKLADEHASHHPEQTQAADASAKQMKEHTAKMQARMEAMQARMKAIEKTGDPQARLPMMKAQMQDMQAMMKDMSAGCPMAAGHGGMGMMDGAMPGMMDHGMHGGAGMDDRTPMSGMQDHAAEPAKSK